MGTISMDKELLKRVLVGPNENETPRSRVVHISTCFGELKYVFEDARVDYYPDPGWPTHYIIWTPNSVHMFEYKVIECSYIGP